MRYGNVKIDYFSKMGFKCRKFKTATDCLLFEIVAENIFFETVVEFLFFKKIAGNLKFVFKVLCF